jgi:primase-polymerase (primpol)-like protein
MVTKRPINPRTGAPASVTERMDWASFQEALDAALKHGLSGIGLVLTEGCGLIGIDLDDAFAPDGQLHPWAKKLVRTLNSYSEISPSGRGIRIFIKGTLPGTRCWKGKVGMYAKARYLTVTGNRIAELDGIPLPSTIEERQVEINVVYREIFPEDNHQPKE